MWAWIVRVIVGFITGGGLTSITKEIAVAVTAAQNAKTEQERIAATERASALQARAAVLAVQVTNPWSMLAYGLLAGPPGVYMAKIFVWDKVLGWGSTDPLTPELWGVVMVVYSYFFVFTPVKNAFTR